MNKMNLDKNTIAHISKMNKEPDWLLNLRIKAFENSDFAIKKHSRRMDYSKFDFTNYSFIENGNSEFNKVTLQRKISNEIYPITENYSLIQIGNNFLKNLKINSIIFTDLKSVLFEAPDIFEKYFHEFFNHLRNEKFVLSNYAFWNNGYFLYVPENVKIDIPLQFLFIHDKDGKMIFMNNFIVLEKGSKITLIDSQTSSGIHSGALVNNMLNVHISEKATLDYICIQEYDRYVNAVNNKKFFLHKNSLANWFEISFGGTAIQNNLESNLFGTGAEVYMQGLYFAEKDQQMEFNTAQLHHLGYTKSDLLYIGALRDNAKTSYEGMIRVAKGAQKTDAYQKNKNLILSKEAHADSEPLLEILANDVRCTHGATVGPVDSEDLFYLMSRGIEESYAKKLLISGFFSEVIQKIPIEEIKNAIQTHIEENI